MDTGLTESFTSGEFSVPCIKCGQVAYRETWDDRLSKWESRIYNALKVRTKYQARYLEWLKDRKRNKWVFDGEKMNRIPNNTEVNLKYCNACGLKPEDVTICNRCGGPVFDGVCQRGKEQCQ